MKSRYFITVIWNIDYVAIVRLLTIPMKEVSNFQGPGRAEYENNGHWTYVVLFQEAPRNGDVKGACALSFTQQMEIHGSFELRSFYPRLNIPRYPSDRRLGVTPANILDTVVVKRKIQMPVSGNELRPVLCILINFTACDVEIVSEV